MYKVLLLCLFFLGTSLIAQNKTDIALTMGNNTFDNPDQLLAHRMFYGIRGGFYQNNGIGFQLGYEQANSVNCPDVEKLNLKRLYTNLLYEIPELGQLHPYALLSAGYEISDAEEVSPSQFFAGLGLGLKYDINNKINTFIDIRALRKFDNDRTNIITTFGIGYILETENKPYSTTSSVPQQYVPISQPEIAVVNEIKNTYTEIKVTTPSKKQHTHLPKKKYRHYYIQIAAFAETDPTPLLHRLRTKGFHARARDVVKRGETLTLVLTGPYKSRKEAQKKLYHLKKIQPDAFITRK